MASTYGDAILRTVGARFEIVSADPTILIHEDLVTEIEFEAHAGAELIDGIIELRGLNRTVRYRLGDYLPDRRFYVAEMI
jgi:hypothetical protein